MRLVIAEQRGFLLPSLATGYGSEANVPGVVSEVEAARANGDWGKVEPGQERRFDVVECRCRRGLTASGIFAPLHVGVVVSPRAGCCTSSAPPLRCSPATTRMPAFAGASSASGGTSALPDCLPVPIIHLTPAVKSFSPMPSISARPHPFEQRRVDYAVPAGLTIAEIVEIIQPDPLLRAHGHVFLGEHLIPREYWHRVRPKHGQLISIRLLPSSGNGLRIGL